MLDVRLFDCFYYGEEKYIVTVQEITEFTVRGYRDKRDPEYGPEMATFNLDDLTPIPITPEILEKNGFVKDGYTNLSPDYYYRDPLVYVSIILRSTPSKGAGIYVSHNKVIYRIDYDRHYLGPVYLHLLQHFLPMKL